MERNEVIKTISADLRENGFQNTTTQTSVVSNSPQGRVRFYVAKRVVRFEREVDMGGKNEWVRIQSFPVKEANNALNIMKLRSTK